MIPYMRAIIFANGNIPNLQRAQTILRPDDFIIAADGGAHHALALQINLPVIIGDLDSINQKLILDLSANGVKFINYPKEKDETDLELALNFALASKYTEIVVIGAMGGRNDHMLGNLALLANPNYADVNLRFDDGVEEVSIIRNILQLRGQVGDTVSLIPWGKNVDGIITTGLRYPLNDETLLAHRTRGISNMMESETAEIKIRAGLLLCIHTRRD
jgi:thiamine pyrophosphokinase